MPQGPHVRTQELFLLLLIKELMATSLRNVTVFVSRPSSFFLSVLHVRSLLNMWRFCHLSTGFFKKVGRDTEIFCSEIRIWKMKGFKGTKLGQKNLFYSDQVPFTHGTNNMFLEFQFLTRKKLQKIKMSPSILRQLIN